MKRIYGLLLLTAFLTPQTSYSLSMNQLKQLNEQYSTAIRDGDRRSACDAYQQLHTAGHKTNRGDYPTPDDRFETQFGDTPAMVCSGRTRGGPAPAPAPAPTTPAGWQAAFDALNKHIDRNNAKFEVAFGPLGTKHNLSLAADKKYKSLLIQQLNSAAAGLAIQVAGLVKKAGPAALPVHDIIIATITDPATMTGADFGNKFIQPQIKYTANALGTADSPKYPTIWTVALSVTTAPFVPVRPVAPVIPAATATADAVLNALVMAYSQQVLDFFSKRLVPGTTDKAQALDGDKEGLLVLAQYAEELNKQAMKCGISSGYITVLSTTPALTGATAKDQLTQNTKQLTSALSFTIGTGWFRSTRHPLPTLYTVLVPVDRPARGTALPAAIDVVAELADDYNAIMDDIFKLSNANMSIKGTKGLDRSLLECNELAFDLIALQTSTEITIANVGTGSFREQAIRNRITDAFKNGAVPATITFERVR